MVFDSLNEGLRNVLIENHSYITKWFIFLFLLFLSSYYLFSVWKTHKPTKFYTVVAYRLFFGACSVGYLVASPFTLLLMSPEYGFTDFYSYHLIFYEIIIVIGSVVLFVDFLRYGFLGILKLGGLDFGDSNVNELIKTFENNKHFLRFNKNGRR